MTKYKKGNELLEILPDEDVINPRRDRENFGIMVCFHKRYDLPNDLKLKSESFEGWEELKEELIKNHNAKYILPIYMYDHSGITIKTTSFGDPWDSGQIGYIFTTQEKLDEFGISLEPTALDMLREEINMFDKYLTGDVYGIIKYEWITCKECGHTDKEVKDSCWGFYGSDFKQNGLYAQADIDITEWEEI